MSLDPRIVGGNRRLGEDAHNPIALEGLQRRGQCVGRAVKMSHLIPSKEEDSKVDLQHLCCSGKIQGIFSKTGLGRQVMSPLVPAKSGRWAANSLLGETGNSLSQIRENSGPIREACRGFSELAPCRSNRRSRSDRQSRAECYRARFRPSPAGGNCRSTCTCRRAAW